MDKNYIKIMLVEDNPEDVIFIEEALEQFKNLKIIFRAEDGRQAISYLQKKGEFTESLTPDIVILDLNLPIIPGKEILKKIKKDKNLSDVKVAILTTSATEKNKKECFDLKADFFFSKPIDYHQYQEIFEQIRGIIQRDNPEKECKQEIEIKILLIEDNPDDSALLNELLNKARKYALNETSYTVTLTETVKEAQEILRSNEFNVVLMDMTLPDSHGEETIDKFVNYFHQIPFIVLSGFSDKRVALKAIKRGVQEYLVKGKVNSELLYTTINHSIERHRMMTMIRSLSLYDELTKLYNRRGFFHLLKHQIKIADRKKRSFPLLYFDLDNFKIVNDTLGHSTGDNALRDTADILRKTFRDSDIIARLGGDEFAVFPYETEINDLKVIKQRFATNIDKFNARKEKKYTISISTGVSIYDPENPCSIDTLISLADKHMYIDKRSKKRRNKLTG